MPFHDCFQTKMVRVTAYPVPLQPKLIALFKRFASHYLEFRIPMKTSRIVEKFGVLEEGKKHCTEYNNWSQLRHHGLISSAGEKWSLTKRGEQFYLGEIQIYSVAGVWRGESLGDTIPDDDAAWQQWSDTKGMPRKLVGIDDVQAPEPQLNHDTFADLRSSANSPSPYAHA